MEKFSNVFFICLSLLMCWMVSSGSAYSGECVDKNYNCQTWAAIGECSNNGAYMSLNCKKSCRLCPPECVDKHRNCLSWAMQGECYKNPQYMHSMCQRSCGKCLTNRVIIETTEPSYTYTVNDCPTGLPRYNLKVFKDKCYEFELNSWMTFNDAKNKCKYNGGTLLTVKNDQVHNFIKNHLKTTYKYQISSNYVWVGAKYNARQRQYYWLDNTVINHPYFDHVNGNPAGMKDCVSMNVNRWIHDQCDISRWTNSPVHRAIICEYAITKKEKTGTKITHNKINTKPLVKPYTVKNTLRPTTPRWKPKTFKLTTSKPHTVSVKTSENSKKSTTKLILSHTTTLNTLLVSKQTKKFTNPRRIYHETTISETKPTTNVPLTKSQVKTTTATKTAIPKQTITTLSKLLPKPTFIGRITKRIFNKHINLSTPRNFENKTTHHPYRPTSEIKPINLRSTFKFTQTPTTTLLNNLLTTTTLPKITLTAQPNKIGTTSSKYMYISDLIPTTTERQQLLRKTSSGNNIQTTMRRNVKSEFTSTSQSPNSEPFTLKPKIKHTYTKVTSETTLNTKYATDKEEGTDVTFTTKESSSPKDVSRTSLNTHATDITVTSATAPNTLKTRDATDQDEGMGVTFTTQETSSPKDLSTTSSKRQMPDSTTLTMNYDTPKPEQTTLNNKEVDKNVFTTIVTNAKNSKQNQHTTTKAHETTTILTKILDSTNELKTKLENKTITTPSSLTTNSKPKSFSSKLKMTSTKSYNSSMITNHTKTITTAEQISLMVTTPKPSTSIHDDNTARIATESTNHIHNGNSTKPTAAIPNDSKTTIPTVSTNHEPLKHNRDSTKPASKLPTTTTSSKKPIICPMITCELDCGLDGFQLNDKGCRVCLCEN